MQKTTIKISKKIKQELEKMKIHPRETYEDVIIRLIKKVKK
jgi:predicted CopG family antitoxin